jgi:hypothetical protein
VDWGGVTTARGFRRAAPMRAADQRPSKAPKYVAIAPKSRLCIPGGSTEIEKTSHGADYDSCFAEFEADF